MITTAHEDSPTLRFDATRDAGLARLAAFAPHAGAAYQARRNYDLTASGAGAVSQLSPWLRHRLISEEEVLTTVLRHHSPQAAMSYVQEVFWRGYFKGWLEQRPSVWSSAQSQQPPLKGAQKTVYAQAVAGETGIACFDHWCESLKRAGYLHNHARMWFASIWIFTLRLPWELGAAFFLQHLRDGDPASNTLSWRWVAGLHTKGKHYLARADNIATFTEGRFFPKGQLVENAAPLEEAQEHPLLPFSPQTADHTAPHILVITEEDCLSGAAPAPSCRGVLGLVSPEASPFAQAAVRNTVKDLGGEAYTGHTWSTAIGDALTQAGVQTAITAHIPVGHVADGMAEAQRRLAQQNQHLIFQTRPYDALVWPHATKGFFKVKKQIPHFLEALNLA